MFPTPLADTQKKSVDVTFNAQHVRELPLVLFGGDYAVPQSTETLIPVQETLGERCTGFVLVNVVGFVKVSINGGPLRTVPSDQQYNNCDIKSIRVVTDVLSSVIVQLHGA